MKYNTDEFVVFTVFAPSVSKELFLSLTFTFENVQKTHL